MFIQEVFLRTFIVVFVVCRGGCYYFIKFLYFLPSGQCPYLDTIDRSVLDFDFEKLCSVSLSRINVYACLICGKYFQGRGPSTHAYVHSVGDFHHVYLNLHTLKFYCLPDNYEVIGKSIVFQTLMLIFLYFQMQRTLVFPVSMEQVRSLVR